VISNNQAVVADPAQIASLLRTIRPHQSSLVWIHLPAVEPWGTVRKPMGAGHGGRRSQVATNDVVLVDGILDQRRANSIPSGNTDEVFELFTLQEVLKDFDLSQDDLEFGWIDGRNDGGLDACYLLINGHLLDDAEDFAWPRSNAAIEVWLFTCKHHATFQQAPLDSILATIQEIFDLSKNKDELRGSYSEELLAFRSLLHHAYRRLSIGRPVINFNIVYASRGDTTQVGESVSARARQIETLVAGLFSQCTATFRFVGASELMELHRKTRRFALDLPFIEHVSTGRGSYVLLVRLDEYWKFVKSEDGSLRRYLFDSNVRDFLGESRVNEDIARSLSDISAPDFWWLNNGITILSTNASVAGKTIKLQEIQIVNGLQTTESVYRHFQSGSTRSSDRVLLVKIIVTTDPKTRDQIIRATNNQNPVEISALHATDKIQRDIEEILERNEWYYERRKNYYRNIGKPQARLVTPLYLASAVIALIFKNPAKATRVRGRFMRNSESYNAVFSPRIPIELWPTLVSIYKQIESGLTRVRDNPGERYVGTWRALISLICVARRLRTFAYAPSQLAIFRDLPITGQEVDDICVIVDSVSAGRRPSNRLQVALVDDCCEQAAIQYGILGIREVGRRNIPLSAYALDQLSEDFVASVDRELPQQPWRARVHIEVAARLDAKPAKVSRAIQRLIVEGKRNQQKDGVVFGPDGRVVAVDAQRVSRSVDELNAVGYRFLQGDGWHGE
jgi:hypothetical protein